MNTNTEQRSPLMRDRNDKIIGGVCAGLSHQVGISPIYMRLIFLLLLMLYGATFPIYLLLWLIMPESPSEQISIETNESTTNQSTNQPTHQRGCLAQAFVITVKAILWLTFGFFALLALLALLGCAMGLIGAMLGLAVASPLGIIGIFYTHNAPLTILVVVLLIVSIAIPIIGLLLLLIRNLRQKELPTKRSVFIVFIIWLLSVLCTIGIGTYEILTNPDVQQTITEHQDEINQFFDNLND